MPQAQSDYLFVGDGGAADLLAEFPRNPRRELRA